MAAAGLIMQKLFSAASASNFQHKHNVEVFS
jgi:hypothetical protein